MAGPRITALHIADPPATWTDLGFAIGADGACRVGATTLLLRPRAGGKGIAGWTLAGATGDGPVDGIPTCRAEPAADPAGEAACAHPNGALAVDHVVVATPDVARTLAALAATGMVLRRERRTGPPERPLRQAFFRHGEAVVEVVGPAEPEGDGPAALWGLTVTVADLDAAALLLAPRLGRPRPAVQPGRRIAPVRSAAGASTALALMSPPSDAVSAA